MHASVLSSIRGSASTGRVGCLGAGSGEIVQAAILSHPVVRFLHVAAKCSSELEECKHVMTGHLYNSRMLSLQLLKSRLGLKEPSL